MCTGTDTEFGTLVLQKGIAYLGNIKVRLEFRIDFQKTRRLDIPEFKIIELFPNLAIVIQAEIVEGQAPALRKTPAE